MTHSTRAPSMACGLALTMLACTGCETSEVADAAQFDAARADAALPDAPGLDAPFPDAALPDAMSTIDAPSTGTFLRDRHPADEGIGSDPAVLFHDDFESGWGRWDAPRANTANLFSETGSAAHAGSGYLRSTVTHAQLLETMYISSSPRIRFPRRVPEVFIRYYARFPNIAPNPHHWVRTAAGTEAFVSSGLANTLPNGNQGFWFDFDANTDSTVQFYAYWHRMRSGRCNDGSITPGCAGDQGTTYYYGNVFQPPEQGAGIPRDAWTCIEFSARANDVGMSNGALSAWMNDAPIGEFSPGTPIGTWLRATFHPGGCGFSACTPPVPFEGFDFRSSSDVLFKEFFLDAYYERGTWERRRDEMREAGLTVSNESTILYDDIVIATERIGCRR